MTTLIMGIVNVTPDSFSDGGRFLDPDAAIARGLLLRSQGAHLLDVGGESTRPGADRVTPRVEQDRVLPVVRALAEARAVVSIDTMNASTALAAVEAGARIVNDVSGGLADPDLLAAVASTDADLVLCHWRGPSADMYARAQYADVVHEVIAELTERVNAAGLAASRRHGWSSTRASGSARRARRTGTCCVHCRASSAWDTACWSGRAASGSSPRCSARTPTATTARFQRNGATSRQR